MHLRRGRPVSWHGRGRLEVGQAGSRKMEDRWLQVRLPTLPMEQENPFLRAEMRGEDEVVRSLTR